MSAAQVLTENSESEKEIIGLYKPNHTYLGLKIKSIGNYNILIQRHRKKGFLFQF